MIRTAVILLALTAPAQAQGFQQRVDQLHCWAYPHHERCRPAPLPAPRPPEAPAEPVQAPLPTPPPAPVVVQPPPVATPQPVPRPPAAAPPVSPKPAKAKPRVKSKPKLQAVAKQAKRKARIPSWCARIPKGTSMATVEAWAPTFGVTMDPANRRKAQACLNSKGI
jgi:hypothetical protein